MGDRLTRSPGARGRDGGRQPGALLGGVKGRPAEPGRALGRLAGGLGPGGAGEGTAGTLPLARELAFFPRKRWFSASRG